MIGEAAPQDEQRRILAAIEGHDEVTAVLDLRTMYIGPGTLLVAARIDLQEGLDVAAIERVSETIDCELRERVASVGEVFLDPTPRGRVQVGRL